MNKARNLILTNLGLNSKSTTNEDFTHKPGDVRTNGIEWPAEAQLTKPNGKLNQPFKVKRRTVPVRRSYLSDQNIFGYLVLVW